MGRPLRIEFPGALYHLTLRGDRREPIYDDDADREQFLATLAEIIERYNWLCHADCLMINHYHLLVETVDGDLSKGMRQQVYLGDDAFVGKMQALATIQGDRLSVPKIQRRPPPATLADIAAAQPDRNAAIATAYATAAYSYAAIAAHFGIHLSTVGRIVRASMKQCEN